MKFKDTMKKFYYPNSIVYENEFWYVLLRFEQVTFCSVILITKFEKNNLFSKLSIEEQISMFKVIQKIETVMYKNIGCDKINYLALMMIDPFIHYHIIPRYKSIMMFNKVEFSDTGYPGLINFDEITKLKKNNFDKLVRYLKEIFNDQK